MGYPQVGSGKGGSGVASTIFQKKDGTDAIFANTGARDAYFQANADELKKLKNSPVGIGTANAITAAYVHDKDGWHAAAINFKGDRGRKGNPGAGVTGLSTVPDGHIPIIVNGQVEDSGILAGEGSATFAPNSVYLGVEKLGGSGETLLITNVARRETRSPLYQFVGPDAAEGFVREHGPRLSKDSGGNSTTLVNPDYNFPIAGNATIFGVEFNFAEAMTNVVIDIFLDPYSFPIWTFKAGRVQAGKQFFDLSQSPLMLKGASSYKAKLHSKDGDVKLKAGTRGKPFSSVKYSNWVDVPVATKAWVQAQIGGSPAHVPQPIIKTVVDVRLDASGDLDIYHSDGSVTKLALPQAPSAGLTVKNVTLDANRDLLITYTDGSTSTVPVDGTGKTAAVDAFVYYGKAIPTYPTKVQSGYFVSLYAMQGAPQLPAPTANQPIPDGTMFLVSNKDINTSLKITGLSAGSQNIGPESVAWFVSKSNKWEPIFVGYVSSSFNTLYADIKRRLAADPTFKPAAPAAPSKVTLINPDGTKFQVDELRLVGMEVVDPANGDPLKLTILNSPLNPKPSATSAYAFFSTSPLAPPTATFSSLPVYRKGTVNVNKSTTDGQYVYILLPPGEGTNVKRVAELGGLPSFWARSSKNYPVNGQSRIYTVLRSPYKFHEKDITFTLYA